MAGRPPIGVVDRLPRAGGGQKPTRGGTSHPQKRRGWSHHPRLHIWAGWSAGQ
jgi:hypothetical protein